MADVTFTPLPPKDALDYWTSKTPVSAERFKKLDAGARSRAFAVAGLANMNQVSAIQEALTKALEEGETLASFKERIASVIRDQGWQGHRIETIFRTNIQQAYLAGRYAQMQEVKKSRPYWQYLAVRDRRVRPSHAVLDGKVYPADHEFWGSNYPPNGFQCRCSVISLSKRQVERTGLKVESKMPAPQMWTDPKTGMEYHVNLPGADKGFQGNAGRDWLMGLGPRELGKGDVVFPKAKTLCKRGKGLFADGSTDDSDVCRPPLSELSERHILPITKDMLLPKGLSEEAYALAFMKEFGLKNLQESVLHRLPKVNFPLVISKELFMDKVANELKANKEGRGAYMKLLAQTIKNPYEIWEVPAEVNKKGRVALRLIRLFRNEEMGKDVGGFGVFNLINGNLWTGATLFNPAKENRKNMLRYLEGQRQGTLLFREE